MRETLRTKPAQDHKTFKPTSTADSMRQNHDISSSNSTSTNTPDKTSRALQSPSKYSAFSVEDGTNNALDEKDMHANDTMFPIADGQQQASSTNTGHIGKKMTFLVEEQKEPIGLEGVVDLTNTVDTTVHEKVAPAVTHEFVAPTEHEIITREIHREIHQHHYYHRILPVIDTEILPAKHYVYGNDGDTLVRIPDSMIPGRVTAESYPRTWQIVENHQPAPVEDVFDSALLGVESELPNMNYTTHHQPNSKGHLPWSRVPGEPVKVMEREYITAEGFPRKETWWRYPPVLATAAYEAGQTVPMHWNHIDAGKKKADTEASVSTTGRENKIKELRDLERAQAAEVTNIDYLDSNMDKLRERTLYGGLSEMDSTHARELNGVQSRDLNGGLPSSDSMHARNLSSGYVTSLPRKPVAHQEMPEKPPSRDSGYSNGYGGLDGCSSPVAKDPSHFRNFSGSSISSFLGKVLGDDGRKQIPQEGEATRYLKRMREKRRSSASSAGTSPKSWGRSEGVGRNSEDVHKRICAG